MYWALKSIPFRSDRRQQSWTRALWLPTRIGLTPTARRRRVTADPARPFSRATIELEIKVRSKRLTDAFVTPLRCPRRVKPPGSKYPFRVKCRRVSQSMCRREEISPSAMSAAPIVGPARRLSRTVWPDLAGVEGRPQPVIHCVLKSISAKSRFHHTAAIFVAGEGATKGSTFIDFKRRVIDPPFAHHRCISRLNDQSESARRPHANCRRPPFSTKSVGSGHRPNFQSMSSVMHSDRAVTERLGREQF